MSVQRYLLHMVQQHINFRWIEFLSLTSKHNCQFTLITDSKLINLTPYIILEVKKPHIDSLIQSVKEAFLIRGLYELWARSGSLEELSNDVSDCDLLKKGNFFNVNQTFKINCDYFGKRLTLDQKISAIEGLKFLDTLDAKLDLKNPDHIFHLLNFSSSNLNQPEYRTLGNSVNEFYFARQVCLSSKSIIHGFNLKDREFIANTTMDPLLSFVATNIAQIEKNQLVYDPFVGSGGLLIPAAFKGAYIFGTDIDFLLLHGKSKPSRINQLVRNTGESLKGNLKQYGLQDYYMDVVVSDVSRSCIKDYFEFDTIITDPPYGVRESCERVGSKNADTTSNGHAVRYPAKVNYRMDDLMKDLLILAAKHLVIGGKLVYFLPVTKNIDDMEAYLPRHPCLKLIYYCEQNLSPKLSRLLITMEKTRHPKLDDQAYISKMLIDMNFRGAYFGEI